MGVCVGMTHTPAHAHAHTLLARGRVGTSCEGWGWEAGKPKGGWALGLVGAGAGGESGGRKRRWIGRGAGCLKEGGGSQSRAKHPFTLHNFCNWLGWMSRCDQ